MRRESNERKHNRSWQRRVEIQDHGVHPACTSGGQDTRSWKMKLGHRSQIQTTKSWSRVGEWLSHEAKPNRWVSCKRETAEETAGILNEPLVSRFN